MKGIHTVEGHTNPNRLGEITTEDTHVRDLFERILAEADPDEYDANLVCKRPDGSEYRSGLRVRRGEDLHEDMRITEVREMSWYDGGDTSKSLILQVSFSEWDCGIVVRDWGSFSQDAHTIFFGVNGKARARRATFKEISLHPSEDEAVRAVLDFVKGVIDQNRYDIQQEMYGDEPDEELRDPLNEFSYPPNLR